MLELTDLSKRYGDERAIEKLSLSVDRGEFLTILGPSGSGKTTALLSIAGHVSPTAGSIHLDGEEITNRPPEKRSLGVVFQRDTLFPHMTARENVAYALGSDDTDWETDSRVDRFCSLVGMAGHAEKYPEQLSGGQRRRIELARALVYEPDVLLLDEPLTGLDRTLRRELCGEIARIHDETDVTTISVTHDQSEALTLSDRIAVLDSGVLAAVGSPQELYEHPPNRFVANFLGAVSTVSASVVDTDPLTVSWAGYRFELQTADGESVPAAAVETGDCFRLYCRPQALTLSPSDEQPVSVVGEVVEITHAGQSSTVQVQTADARLGVAVGGFPDHEAGDQLRVGIDTDELFGFVADQRLVVAAVSKARVTESQELEQL